MSHYVGVWHSVSWGSRLFLAAFSLNACSFVDPELEDEPDDAPAADAALETPSVCEPEPAFGLLPAGPPPSIAPAQADEPEPPRCPERMLEVRGKYCSDLMNRCIKGGRNHLGEEAPEPEPFYCEKYQVGFAKCLGKETDRHFCIDEYEYPNQQGTIPVVMVSWYESKQLCEVQGKRLCGDDEWTLACEGPERRPYPYGWERDKTACNIDRRWLKPNDGLLASKTATPVAIQTEVDRLSQRVASGSMPDCKSPYGVMDMAGNVDEWAVNVTLRGKPYQSVFKGGHWVSGARNRCRPVTASHDETTAYYAEGFRCCADSTAPTKQ